MRSSIRCCRHGRHRSIVLGGVRLGCRRPTARPGGRWFDIDHGGATGTMGVGDSSAVGGVGGSVGNGSGTGGSNGNAGGSTGAGGAQGTAGSTGAAGSGPDYSARQSRRDAAVPRVRSRGRRHERHQARPEPRVRQCRRRSVATKSGEARRSGTVRAHHHQGRLQLHRGALQHSRQRRRRRDVDHAEPLCERHQALQVDALIAMVVDVRRLRQRATQRSRTGQSPPLLRRSSRSGRRYSSGRNRIAPKGCRRHRRVLRASISSISSRSPHLYLSRPTSSPSPIAEQPPDDDSDDQPAIQACIDQAHRAGKGLYIPKGTFPQHRQGAQRGRHHHSRRGHVVLDHLRLQRSPRLLRQRLQVLRLLGVGRHHPS